MSSESGKRKPSFSGNSVPADINPIGLNDGGDEISRRVAFEPNFDPMPSFEPDFVQSSDEMRSVISSKIHEPTRKNSAILRPNGIWRLESVPILPEFHRLERTSVLVPNASPLDVSIRISDILRDRSIEALYENDKAKAKCTSAEGVDFRVRLYRGRGRFDHDIIVEVQRRFGTSNAFHNDTMAILHAAQGKMSPPIPLSDSNLPLISDASDGFECDASSSLNMISMLLSSPGYDSNFLALQTLLSLTDVSKMGVATARSVSTELLRLDTVNVVGSKVMTLIVDQQGDNDTFKLRSMALHVAANAFQSVQGNVPIALKDQLRFVLIQELRLADKSPRNAAQAARILEFFLPEDNGSDLHSALERAISTGASRSACLERQAKVCLDKLV